MKFSIEKKLPHTLARAGKIETPHGVIETPAFIVVGTKASVKSLTPAQVEELGAQSLLANTYHLYLEPGDEKIKAAGGLHTYAAWDKPTFTDSGGFQVFSLGAAMGKSVGKVATGEEIAEYTDEEITVSKLAHIDEEGVTFKSFLDGSEHRFTPERSIQIQQNIGADIIFAFDECTSPLAPLPYQKEALERTHRWAERSLTEHKKVAGNPQGLMGIVQGGRFEELRKESARTIGAMDFDGFGIGGSFVKEDMSTAVKWVNEILPEEKPRHLLGIGEPIDMFLGAEHGCDTFDCVAPTRIGRTGSLYTKHGKINVLNNQYREDYTPIEKDCGCYACRHFTKAYIAHLFRAKEMLGPTLGSIHNLYFIVNLVKEMRARLLDGTFLVFKDAFIKQYYRT
jgi:queuine tRNA-ribosyltransferase